MLSLSLSLILPARATVWHLALPLRYLASVSYSNLSSERTRSEMWIRVPWFFGRQVQFASGMPERERSRPPSARGEHSAHNGAQATCWSRPPRGRKLSSSAAAAAFASPQRGRGGGKRGRLRPEARAGGRTEEILLLAGELGSGDCGFRGDGHKGRESHRAGGGGRGAVRVIICRVLGPSLPLHLQPDQSEATAEIATWAIQQPSRTRLVIVLILP